jgi:hypothetical protein
LNKNVKSKKINKTDYSKEQDYDQVKKKIKNNEGHTSETSSNLKIGKLFFLNL